jgi:hypothetical protein
MSNSALIRPETLKNFKNQLDSVKDEMHNADTLALHVLTKKIGTEKTQISARLMRDMLMPSLYEKIVETEAIPVESSLFIPHLLQTQALVICFQMAFATLKDIVKLAQNQTIVELELKLDASIIKQSQQAVELARLTSQLATRNAE